MCSRGSCYLSSENSTTILLSLFRKQTQMTWHVKYWNLTETDCRRKRHRPFDHKFILWYYCEIISFITELGRISHNAPIYYLQDEKFSTWMYDVMTHSVWECVENQAVFFLNRNHRNLKVPNRVIQSKFLSRHIGFTKHIGIGMTLSLSDNVRQEDRTLFFDDRIEWQHILVPRLVDNSSDL